MPALVEEVIPTQIKPGELQKVMQNLLRERVPVRDLETIIETLGDYSTRTKDLDVLTEYVRNALARTICKQYVDDRDRLWCLTLDPALEELINGHLERSERGTTNTMPPQTAQQIVQQYRGQSDGTDAGGPIGGDAVQPADSFRARTNDRIEPAARGGAGVQRSGLRCVG